MQDKKFMVKGTFIEKGKTSTFSKEVNAVNKALAAEKILSRIGSNHKIKRNAIKINETTEAD